MRGVRFISLSLACLLLPAHALCLPEELSGSVVAGCEASVTAPFGGSVSAVYMREGEWVEAGDVLATLSTVKVYAPLDGTVSGVLFDEGDSVEGAVLNIAPVNKYAVTATVAEQYGSQNPANRYINLGETVYIRCQKDRSHTAAGCVTAADGALYTVETTSGELCLDEAVDVFRDSGFAFASMIGSGTVARTDAWAVTGSGSLLRLHVSNGEAVARGQLLFETVEGPLDGYLSSGSDVLSTVSGVISEASLNVGDALQKGGSVAVLYPREGFQLAVVVPEDMINLLHQGDKLRFYLDWDEDSPRWYEGTVASLSYISAATAEDTTTFTAYLDFIADEMVRLGMTAVVELNVP